MKRFLSILMLINMMNFAFYPYILMAQTADQAAKQRKTAATASSGKIVRVPPKSFALSRSAKNIKVMWNKEAFTNSPSIEIVRTPAFVGGAKMIKADKASFIDNEVADGKQYQYTVSSVDNKGVKTPIKTMKAWFGAKNGTAFAGTKSRVEYDGFNLAFKGNEFKSHKNKNVRVRISPNTVEEETLIQASELFEVTLDDAEQPVAPVTAEISYNTINMPKGYTEKDLKVFIRHNAKAPWETAKIVSIDKTQKIIFAEMPHFSEIMAGFVGAPGESQTRANVNTALPKVTLPDPFAGKMRIAPPQPNISGSLSQSIPIVLPSGKAGMSPELSLVYNSGQKNGLSGYGWALAAGDNISYIKKDGGYVYTCGAGELTNVSGNAYRLKYENSFARYEYNQGSETWLVIKDGYTNIYGENNMRLTNNLPGLSSKQWLLTRKLNPDAVAINYSYKLTPGNELILTNVSYEHFSIDLVYDENRSDPFSYTSALGYYTMNERLTNIQIKTELGHIGTYSLDRQYVLSYTASDVGSLLLTKVELKHADGTLLSQVDMTYKVNDLDNSINPTAENWNTDSARLTEDKQFFMPMDINGDGLQDFLVVTNGGPSDGKFKIYTNSGQSMAGVTPLWHINDGTQNIDDFPMDRIHFQDMNGDGLPDIVANFTGYNGTTQGTWEVFTNSGSGFVLAPSFTLTASIDPSHFNIIDINGDGKPDFVINRSGLNGTNWVAFDAYTNSGSGMGQTAVTWQSAAGTAVDPAAIQMNDVTGDGLPDLLVRNDTGTTTGWNVYMNTGSGFSSTALSFSIPKTDPQFIRWTDINGDGMKELTVLTNNGTSEYLSFYTNTGSSLSSTATTWNIPVTDPYELNFQDVNGDGKPDMVVSYQNTTIRKDVYLNNGNGFNTQKMTVDLKGTEPSAESYFDINSDGAPDSVVNNTDGSLTVYKGIPNFNYLLNSIDANHLLITYEYSNVNAGLGFPKTVLAKSTVNNELPSTDPGYFSKDTFYAYDQGKYDRINRIMYGFGKVAAFDSLGNQSIAYYSQTGEEMIGRALTNESYVGLATPKLVSRTINNYATQNVNDGNSKIVLLLNTISIVKALDDQNQTLAKKTDYYYYGLDYSPSGAAANAYYLLYQKRDRQTVSSTDYSNLNSNDDVYQEYYYTPEGASGNITPKLCRSLSYMGSGEKLGETQYAFVGASGYGQIAASALVLQKKVWNGTDTGNDKWISSANRYDAADHWRLLGTTVSNEKPSGNTLVNTTDYSYDGTARFVTMTSNNYLNTVAETSKSVNDPVWGMPLAVIDNNNQTNYYRYDKWNRLIATYAPGDLFDASVAQTGLSDYSAFNTNPLDTASSLYTYGSSTANANITYTKALKRMIRNQDGFTESIAFLDGMARTLQTKISHRNAAGNKIYVASGKMVYDQTGRVIESNDPISTGTADTLETYYSYGSASNNPVTTTYDDLGRATGVSKGSGASLITSSVQYIGLTNVVTTDPEGNKKETINDEYGRVKKVIDYTGKLRQNDHIYATIDYTYNNRGNLASTRDIAGNTISMTYDELGRKNGMTDPDMGTWSYEYDDFGRLITTTDAKGQVARNIYDDSGRLQVKNFDNSAAPQVIYTYGDDPAQFNNGRLISVQDGSGTEEYTYNQRGEVVETDKTVDGVTYISTTEYDALGRVLKMVYPHPIAAGDADKIKLKYTYQTYSGLLNSIDQLDYSSETNVRNYLTGIQYDVMGRRTSMTYGNGVTTTYTYDAVKSMLSNCNITVGQNTLRNIVYTFDKVGNLLENNETEFYTQYEYDDLYRLKKTRFASFLGGLDGYARENTYDALGNIQTKDVDTLNSYPGNRNYQYNSAKPHAVASFTGSYKGDNNAAYTFTYDANGNMSQESIAYQDNGSQTSVKDFTWDGENRLTALSFEGNAWNYNYDYTGERVKKVKNPGQANEDATIYINGMAQYHNGNGVFPVFDGVNRIVSISKIGTGGIFYIHTDHVGSTTLITTETGSVYKRIVFRSFGEVYEAWDAVKLWHVQGTNEFDDIGNYLFTGQEQDSETGLYYYGARYYDPNIGRFISADTKIDGGGVDTQGYGRYIFARNNPVIYSDPSGHWVIDLFFIKIAGGDDAKGGIDVTVGVPHVVEVHVSYNDKDGLKVGADVLSGLAKAEVSVNKGVINANAEACWGFAKANVDVGFIDGLFVQGYVSAWWDAISLEGQVYLTGHEVSVGLDLYGGYMRLLGADVGWQKDVGGFADVALAGPSLGFYADTAGANQLDMFGYVFCNGEFFKGGGAFGGYIDEVWGYNTGAKRDAYVDERNGIEHRIKDYPDELAYYHDYLLGNNYWCKANVYAGRSAKDAMRNDHNSYNPRQRHVLSKLRAFELAVVLTPFVNEDQSKFDDILTQAKQRVEEKKKNGYYDGY